MTTDKNKNTARRLLACIDKNDWAAIKELCAPAVQISIAGQALDLPSWSGMGQMFASAFPDGRHDVDDAVAEGDRVIVRCTWHGTHKGAFQGIPASGKTVALATFIETKIVDGRVVEYRGLFDALGMMQQIGAMPSAAAA